jgi:hypothetical protein
MSSGVHGFVQYTHSWRIPEKDPEMIDVHYNIGWSIERWKGIFPLKLPASSLVRNDLVPKEGLKWTTTEMLVYLNEGVLFNTQKYMYESDLGVRGDNLGKISSLRKINPFSK